MNSASLLAEISFGSALIALVVVFVLIAVSSPKKGEKPGGFNEICLLLFMGALLFTVVYFPYKWIFKGDRKTTAATTDQSLPPLGFDTIDAYSTRMDQYVKAAGKLPAAESTTTGIGLQHAAKGYLEISQWLKTEYNGQDGLSLRGLLLDKGEDSNFTKAKFLSFGFIVQAEAACALAVEVLQEGDKLRKEMRTILVVAVRVREKMHQDLLLRNFSADSLRTVHDIAFKRVSLLYNGK